MINIQTPEWVKNAVFYQIFPDRFARSQQMKHPRGVNLKPWGSDPAEQGHQGGDLYGVAEKLDYMKDLGITAIYLNPIFSASSNHRYNAYDFLEVDPILGGNDALRFLLDEAHARDIRIILDGVFNHASRGFWPFHHVLENGKDSPYADWFHIEDMPLRPYSYTKRKPANYKSWMGNPHMPKMNTDNPGMRDYLFNVARHWLDFGIDGWRLDVVTEIDDGFWREFRGVVKEANPEAYIVGEIWYESKRWLQGDMFDAVMNYIFTKNAINFFGNETLRRKEYKHNELTLKGYSAVKMGKETDAMHNLYDWEINYAQLNLLDSHDTPRVLWIMGDDKSALRLSVMHQMTMPGAPCIYYGDEIGMSSDTDPYCREAFPWDETNNWDEELLSFYQKATALRHAHPVLRTGDFESIYAKGDVYAYRRKLGDTQAVVAFNVSKIEQSINLKKGFAESSYTQVWPKNDGFRQIDEKGLTLNIPAREVVILIG